MPILKKNEPLPERPVVITLYGEPGSGKTSLGNTAADVLVLDADRGVSRSLNRQDTLVIDSWEDVEREQKANTLDSYKTIVIDTAKAVLDDFLMSYVIKRDFKLKTNKLKAYGEIGDEFKLFVNYCRIAGKDLIILAHAKKDEDTKKIIPDVTGQSYQLILRISDQVGYTSFVNNVRTIQWTPTDLTVGKNTADLPTMNVPGKAEPAMKTFMADVITAVKTSIVSMSEEQRLALEQSDKLQEELATVESPAALTELLKTANGLPQHLKAPLQKLIGEKAKAKGWIPNKDTKCFELPPQNGGVQGPPATTSAPAASAKTEGQQDDENEILPTSFDDRCMILGRLGMTMEVDQAVIGKLTISYTDLGEMPEEDFNDLVVKVNQEKKNVSKKKTPGRKTAA